MRDPRSNLWLIPLWRRPRGALDIGDEALVQFLYDRGQILNDLLPAFGVANRVLRERGRQPESSSKP
jgi:hypothetical protein